VIEFFRHQCYQELVGDSVPTSGQVISLIGVEKKLFSSLEGFCDLNSKLLISPAYPFMKVHQGSKIRLPLLYSR
jgi:hypothetical protein